MSQFDRAHMTIDALVVTHAMLRRLTSWHCIIIIIIIVTRALSSVVSGILNV